MYVEPRAPYHRVMKVVIFCLLFLLHPLLYQGCSNGDLCQNDEDCAKEERCKVSEGAKKCVPLVAPGCKKDADCPKDRPRCKIDKGLCQQCLSKDDCDLDQICKNSFCKFPDKGCSSDADCLLSGQSKCDKTAKKCVGCLQNSDCHGGRICHENTCITPGSQTESPNTESTPGNDTSPGSDAPKPDAVVHPDEPGTKHEPSADKTTEQTTQPDAGPGPDKTVPDAVKPDVVQPDVVKPDVVKPDTVSCLNGAVGCRCKAGKCNAGLLCLQAPYKGQLDDYCYQDCSKNKNICASNKDGRTTCQVVTQTAQGQDVSVCVKVVNKGQACNPQKAHNCKTEQIPPLYCSETLKPGVCLEAVLQTNPNTPCNKPGEFKEPRKICDTRIRSGAYLTCENGVCKRYSAVKRFGVCGGITKRCSGNDICVLFGQGSKTGYCFERCTTGGASCAGGTGTCQALQSGGGFCQVNTGKRDAVCGNAMGKTSYNPALSCSKGNVCVIFESGETIGSCLNSIKAGQRCATGRREISLQSGTKVCAKTCTRTTQCGSQHRCILGTCTPQGLGGTLDFAKICTRGSAKANEKCCNGSGKQAACRSGSRKDYLGMCVKLNSSSSSTTKGFCTSDCTTRACPTVSGRRVSCLTLRSGEKICAIYCISSSQCPTGMMCNTGARACVER